MLQEPFANRKENTISIPSPGGSNALSSSEATGLDTCIDVSCVKTSHFKSQGRSKSSAADIPHA